MLIKTINAKFASTVATKVTTLLRMPLKTGFNFTRFIFTFNVDVLLPARISKLAESILVMITHFLNVFFQDHFRIVSLF